MFLPILILTIMCIILYFGIRDINIEEYNSKNKTKDIIMCKTLKECSEKAFEYCKTMGIDPMLITFDKDGAYVINENGETSIKEFKIKY